MSSDRILERLLFGPEANVREVLGKRELLGDGAEFNYVFEDAGRGRGRAKFASEHYRHVAAREYTGPDARPNLIKESLGFEYVKLSQRSYRTSS